MPMLRTPEPVRSEQQVPEQFPGLKLGHLLGKGSYGRVYRGTWRGETIAAKVAVSLLIPPLCSAVLCSLLCRAWRRASNCGLGIADPRMVPGF